MRINKELFLEVLGEVMEALQSQKYRNAVHFYTCVQLQAGYESKGRGDITVWLRVLGEEWCAHKNIPYSDAFVSDHVTRTFAAHERPEQMQKVRVEWLTWLKEKVQ